jgi:hypothetical protein
MSRSSIAMVPVMRIIPPNLHRRARAWRRATDRDGENS